MSLKDKLKRATKVAMVGAVLATGTIVPQKVEAQNASKNATKPNIVVIFGDDIGTTNISAYSGGLMGYETPNIDRLAKEGIKFQHYYGEQSCTAGRAAFITGQHGIRTGLTKVGFPGADMGISQEDPTIAVFLKSLGYATGQFGKNHLGDRNDCLPTVNGFDEFYGNLYHLNAEEEPELPNYPKDPAYKERYGPRGVLDCKASSKDDATIDPRFGRVGKQTINDTGALTKKRMETIDDETSAQAIDFIKRNTQEEKPFFCWFNSTRMHLRTHVRDENRGKYQYGDSEYIDGMIEHDITIGEILKALDDLEISDNTIVIYTTDNGPHVNSWPDAAITPFRSEKNTNWEGAFRVPCIVRWPGHIEQGSVTNELMSHNDWLPTLCSWAGDEKVIENCLNGHTYNGKSYNVHIDGYDQSKFLTTFKGTDSKNGYMKSARNNFIYSDDDGTLVAYRRDHIKYVYAEQRAQGTLAVWAEPFTKLRLQKIFDLMQDPYERADITSNIYWDWQLDQIGSVYGATGELVTFIQTFEKFPPRSFPPSFVPTKMMQDAMMEIKVERKINERKNEQRIMPVE